MSATYDLGNGKVGLILDDGRALALTAGRHIEEASMATTSNFALRIPPSLMEDVKALATQDGPVTAKPCILAICGEDQSFQ